MAMGHNPSVRGWTGLPCGGCFHPPKKLPSRLTANWTPQISSEALNRTPRTKAQRYFDVKKVRIKSLILSPGRLGKQNQSPVRMEHSKKLQKTSMANVPNHYKKTRSNTIQRDTTTRHPGNKPWNNYQTLENLYKATWPTTCQIDPATPAKKCFGVV